MCIRRTFAENEPSWIPQSGKDFMKDVTAELVHEMAAADDLIIKTFAPEQPKQSKSRRGTPKGSLFKVKEVLE